MTADERYMKRCLVLAAKGLGHVAPNPMVGCVIVHGGKIIGEGFHQRYGKAHAEVNAIRSVKNKALLPFSTLYVSLEPCAHFGKTPPCADLIIHHRIPRVVIGCADPNPRVKGKGSARLRKHGISVTEGVLGQACRSLNKRFITFMEKGRPYVILKWAQTADGHLDLHRAPGSAQKPLRISNALSQKRSHQWRTEEQAILVGTNTALLDDPRLSARKAKGQNPLRAVIDKDLVIPPAARLLDGTQHTLVFTAKRKRGGPNIEYAVIRFQEEKADLRDLLRELHHRGIASLIVEGGAALLHDFIGRGCWDEARVFTGKQRTRTGVKAPHLKTKPGKRERLGSDRLFYYRSKNNKFAL
jgi:diaminohydroxyphosphoribosylaminopyrimidine deaminase/5-amino-6-(5-phosphoribosylamino)uracil reductase